MQARAQSVGRGGDIFRGTLQRLRMGWGARQNALVGLAGLAGRAGTSRQIETTISLPASLAPAHNVTAELETARSEIARQSELLAAMTAETERIRSEARAVSLSRSEVLASISHDLRTPLNAVIGFSEAMQRELYGPLGHERYRDYAVHIRESGEMLLKAAEAMIAQNRTEARPEIGSGEHRF
jgi:signal transduction histidine kinase